jgi:hypothetical protein
VLRGIEYFGYVAAAGNVVRARPMATLATLVRWAAFRIERGLPVRRFLPIVVEIFVTSLACV